MLDNNKIWATEKLEYLISISPQISFQENENLKISYVVNLLKRIDSASIKASPTLIKKVDEVFRFLTLRKSLRAQRLISYSRVISELMVFVRKHHNLIPANYHKQGMLAWGTGFGVSFGLIVGAITHNISLSPLGIPFGLAVSFIGATILDKRAVMKNRVL